MKNITLNLPKFCAKFGEIYNYLYDHEETLPDFRDHVNAFDVFAPNHKDFIREFNQYRKDFISSDREAAAFMYALEEMMPVAQ